MIAGHRGDRRRAREGLGDGDPSVRAAALGALGRLADLGAGDLLAGLADPSAAVRRRAAQEAAAIDEGADHRPLDDALVRTTSDPDPLVVDAACWALGERQVASAVGALAAATTHPDIRCRET
ncbi:MAG TPA: HEAT repeat domain-containing protein, partial [Acidimicrobiales bacterium]|nr:HEAT repeat domain-containing protein [Acidimicrobiales bacterium]